MGSLIGKKVFNVPKESVGGVENVLAICDAGQLDNKVTFTGTHLQEFFFVETNFLVN
jgi:hypothetical protein